MSVVGLDSGIIATDVQRERERKKEKEKEREHECERQAVATVIRQSSILTIAGIRGLKV